MVATFHTSIGSFDNVTGVNRPRFILGQTFDVKLRGVYSSVSWSGDNDEVLDIDDDNGPEATIEATAVGKSKLTLTSGRDQLIIVIEVYEEPTVTVGMTFGNVRDREQ